jgi:hypothetical protein
MLQAAGMNAGVGMVWKSEHGALSNNGHALTYVRLSDGAEVFVDASEQHPFSTPEGVFLRVAGQRNDYRFVRPQFEKAEKDSAPIVGQYRHATEDRPLPDDFLEALDLPFLRSQFLYYRGERVEGGIIASDPTAKGLAESDRLLTLSVQACPYNPLAYYQLGRVRYRRGETKDGLARAAKAHKMYTRYGYIPAGVEQMMALTQRRRRRH